MRESALQQWLSKTLHIVPPQLTMISGDASFRRYFRFTLKTGETAIAVDAPPSTEKNQQFVALAKALCDQGIAAPKVLAANFDDGFLCIEDLGSSMLEDQLNQDSAQQLYRQALDLIVHLQTVKRSDLTELDTFDRAFIQRELDIFAEWFAGKELCLAEGWQDSAAWDELCDSVSRAILEQPYVPMHRDFHSRNLMLHKQQMVMIDFQDMVWGPVSYDVVSLLRDCYIAWPEPLVDGLNLALYQTIKANFKQDVSAEQWQRWFDLTGLQRHLKAIGIFCRLDHRDGKTAYRAAIPQTLNYVMQVSARYPELAKFNQWLKPISEGFKQ
ncbi:aminoglycoside phosphotransferase family protein [Agarivorans sp. DSG3-1]|uniref:aminoglycoside phosphotransferase family protein n=1 Tax=Agarivorans sp. DSG3-1 TaxID=3342249 RepID=UPI00398F00CF